MPSAHDFLASLAVVLSVAAVTTVAFSRLRQPVVLGYLIAGLIVGPHVPLPLVADPAVVKTLSEMGVILLMFSLGLEFSLRKLLRVGATATITAVIQCSAMMWLGVAAARALGWTTKEALFAGAAIAISSTTIIAKAFDEQRVKGPVRQLVLGVLIVEDLIAIFLMAALTAVSSGAGLTAGALALTTGRLVAFLVALVVLGLLVVPRAVRAVVRIGSPETTLVASLGLCFALSLLAQAFGYSVALGAFLAGALVSESGEEKTVEHLVRPVRDVFAAIFFVSVGMLIEPQLVAQHWVAVLTLTLLVIVGKVVTVALGAFLTGNGTRTSIAAGMSLAQIGEFSFIIAGLGLSLRATGDFLYPVAVAVSALTTLTTPWLIRAAAPTATFVDQKLPRALQTFASLYGSWIERLREGPRSSGAWSDVRRLIRRLVVDAVLVVLAIIAYGLGREAAVRTLTERAGVRPAVASALALALLLLVAAPFALGMVRLAGRLGATLADAALPAREKGKLDRAAAPRRALVVTLQLAITVALGVPMVALTQPFLPGFPLAIALSGLVAALGIAFWRSAANLHGHVRAGAEMIAELLAAQSHSQQRELTPVHSPSLQQVEVLLPGLGAPTPLQIEPGSAAVGKSLAALNLRGLTGATVLAISRREGSVLVPTAQEVLQADDVLAVAGTHEAVEAARELLAPARPPGAPGSPGGPSTQTGVEAAPPSSAPGS